MTTTTNAPNGRVSRKTLADQIDRLDGILDGLSDGLNDAVVSAVREAVGVAVHEAVRTVLSEVLTNPEVLAKLRNQIAPPVPAASTVTVPADEPPVVTAPRGTRLRFWVASAVRAAGRVVTAAREGVHSVVAGVQASVELLFPYREPLLLAASVGVLVGALAYVAGPWLSALAGGVGGFATTLAVQAGVWLRRTLGAVPRLSA